MSPHVYLMPKMGNYPAHVELRQGIDYLLMNCMLDSSGRHFEARIARSQCLAHETLDLHFMAWEPNCDVAAKHVLLSARPEDCYSALNALGLYNRFS